jgi:acylphosphatase
MSDRRRVRIYVGGRVQGVWFRGSMCERARNLRVEGWVRNLSDGRVEALVEGSRTDVDAIVEWCRQGPPGARVDDLQVVDEALAAGREDAGPGFRIAR